MGDYRGAAALMDVAVENISAFIEGKPINVVG